MKRKSQIDVRVNTTWLRILTKKSVTDVYFIKIYNDFVCLRFIINQNAHSCKIKVFKADMNS